MTWEDILKDEIKKNYFKELVLFVKESYQKETTYPSKKDIFKAFELTLFDDIKVVILGQDPYHGINQANGLAFSVNKDIAIPPSLQNIFTEIRNDLGIQSKFVSGDLTKWAKQGVFLLNSILTVSENKPASHANIGWETFTSFVIESISKNKENVYFLLWGKFAQSKKYLIDGSKHKILETTHPSPFSAHKGFLGCKHFSEVLKDYQIDWVLE